MMNDGYKLGNLPTTFRTRKLQGKYTVFKDDDEKFILYIDTDFLNKNSSIIKDKEDINMSEDNKLFNILSEKIGDREDVTITLDNTGAIVLAKPDTQEEVVIEAEQLPIIESVFEFLTENNVNFSLFDHIGKGSLENRKNALKVLTPVLPALRNFLKETTDFLSNSTIVENKKYKSTLEKLARSYKDIFTKIKDKFDKYLNDPEVKRALKVEQDILKKYHNKKSANTDDLRKRYKELSKNPEGHEKELADIKHQLNLSEKTNFDDSIEAVTEKALTENLAFQIARLEMFKKTFEPLSKTRWGNITNGFKKSFDKIENIIKNIPIDEELIDKYKDDLKKPVEDSLKELALEEENEKAAADKAAQEKAEKEANQTFDKIKEYAQGFLDVLGDEAKAKLKKAGFEFSSAKGLIKAMTEAKKGNEQAMKALRGWVANNIKDDPELITKITKYMKENKDVEDIPDKKSEEKNEKVTDLDFSVKTITDKYVTSFDAHQVKDSEFGITWEDKFGSQWSSNPDEDPDAKLIWESADGKEQPTDEPKVDEKETEEGDLGGDEGGEDDLDLGGDEDLGGDDDLDLGDDSEGEDDLDLGEDEESSDESFSEDDDLDLDLEDDSDSDDLDLDLGDDLSEDDDLDMDLEDDSNLGEELDEESQESDSENLSKALDVIHDMYNKMVDKIK